MAITQTFETGDIQLSEEARRSTLYNVWIWYRDRVATTLIITVSLDGGVTFGASKTAPLVGADDGKLQLVKVPFISEGWTHRVRIATSGSSEELDLERVWLEFEERATV